MSEASALSGLKVLDLSERYAHYCGKLFADMGADVTLVEKPRTGCALTLDLERPEGRELFVRLVRNSDLVVEDRAPGALDALGLGYPALAAIRPENVVTSITPFGQTGPYARYAADDLTLLAMGGFLHMMGYPDAAPTQACGNQAYAMGNMFAAVGSMMTVLGARSATWDARELMTKLQASGVPSGVVQNAQDLIEDDAQLAHRKHWITLEHKEMGSTLYNASPVRLSRTPANLSRPAPLLGEHTEEVCLDLLGMTRSQFDELRAAGVFE